LLINISCPRLSFIPLDEALREIEGKFEGIELLAEEEHSAEKIKRTGLRTSIHAPFNDLNIASLKEEHRLYSVNEIKKAILAAERNGIELVTFHPGWPSPFSMLAKDRVIENAKKSIEELNSFASAHRVTLCAENLPNFFSTAEELLEVTDNICFDVGHANITKTIDTFLDHKKSIKNVHIHENRGEYDEHLAVSGRYIDIESIIKELGNKNYVIEATSIADGERSRDFLLRL
jgi:sugar phosphate isomerase/epimerase